ncbi:putative cation diffusion facilitator [Rhizoctonia solani 123E]|uniref:Putative cation diffusion facilitator n=1 Tax=Rhizoctonia solani 123E TaxID=1423351 RepID=A0A074SKI4_9AGAM|nr:putative cation diffusion facilitator [Rhizoctonia solani 123E]
MMTSLRAATVPSYVERARSRRTFSLLGDLEANRAKEVFEVPYPPWSELYMKSSEELANIRKKAVREYYDKQNQTLSKFKEVDELLSGELVHHVLYSFENPSETTQLLPSDSSISKREKDKERLVQLAINLNFALNVLLLSGKGVAVLLSGSVSIWASFVDSFMDFLSTVIVIWTTYVISSSKKQGDQGRKKVPTGKQRMEPLGVVIFSVFMIAMFLQVGVEGIKRLVSGANEEFALDRTTIIIMAVTIATKTVAWQLSARIKSNGVQALAQDNKNDVFFTTFSVIFPGVASATHLPWLDPLGGIILSLYIIIEWTKTLMTNFRQLSGRAADPDEYRRMLYLITRFTTPKVSYLEVYHAGTELVCEADVQFPKETSFEEVHNVAEAIQVALECLEDVNRAYIHADFTVLNPASHVRRIS